MKFFKYSFIAFLLFAVNSFGQLYQGPATGIVLSGVEVNTSDFSPAPAGNVSIKVYDVLGNEVAILLDEEKSAGRYEVNWDAKNDPSGVYTYRIEAGEYTEVKKMVLLR